MMSRCPQLLCLLAISFCILGIAVSSLAALVPPKLIPLSRIAQLRKGERYHVTCSTSDGSPPLTFSWSKDGRISNPEKILQAPPRSASVG
ncbi:down syndrome cell adhesion molecule [Trichonephila inaurata madagascariensis]|uniref:Down syndrome cell adhesion molecule n=1 Tax=Trichonephila inaurata madagascariensis TaxID=2747483 RepID=A0A8X6XF56_9ARAC|nr:down syndrome cell adhesion molecule [Trichonephila inaurata madagascariensis]